MTYDLPSPAFIGTAPCSPRISESAAAGNATGGPATASQTPCADDAAAGAQFQSQAKEPEADAGPEVTTAGLPVMGSSRLADERTSAATSEIMDATAGETAPFRVPPGYVLLERDVLESLIHRIADYASRADDLAVHSFLANPDFSRAFERAAE